MTTIHTIAGPKDTADLGATLSHEHLCSGFGGMDKTTIFDFDEAGKFKRVIIWMAGTSPLV